MNGRNDKPLSLPSATSDVTVCVWHVRILERTTAIIERPRYCLGENNSVNESSNEPRVVGALLGEL